jgi:hypothetical protein
MARSKNSNVESVNNDVVEATVENTIKKEINMNDNVLVMNNTIGSLIIRNEVTNKVWRIEGYGKMVRMQVSDIFDIMGSQSIIFEDAWAIILDDAVADYVGYSELYKNIIKPKDIKNLLKLPQNEIEEILTNAPNGMKLTVARYLQEKINNNDPEIDSISKRKFFEDLLNVKFNEK